ncbi:MAG: hypothetical protein ACK4N5_21100 [Myxococcales bacterium]
MTLPRRLAPALVVALLGAGAPASGSPAAPEDVVEDGRHLRLDAGERGGIHVWLPAGYQRRTAGVLVYLHGYYTDVDQAWEQHRLAAQFRESRRNALFIVPEAPVNNPDTVKWEDLGELLAFVRAHSGLPLPGGPVVVMGHSGAFRTIVPWMKSKRMSEIILLDGLYKMEDEFKAWLTTHPRRRAHRLILVGYETSDRTERFLKQFPRAQSRPSIPESFEKFSPNERRARLFFLKSQFDHMEMVTSGKVIPLLLRLAPFGEVKPPRAR